MAKRKKTNHRRRRRSVSGFGKTSTLINIAGIAAGAVVAKLLSTQLGKSGKIEPKLISGGQLLLGVFLPQFFKGPIGVGMGAGLIAVGSMSLLQGFGVLQGIGNNWQNYALNGGVGNGLTIIGRDPGSLYSPKQQVSGVGSNMGNLAVMGEVDPACR